MCSFIIGYFLFVGFYMFVFVLVCFGLFCWFVVGDFNGFFGLVVDNLLILGFIVMVLVGIF